MRIVKIAGVGLAGALILVAAMLVFGIGGGWLVGPLSRIEASTGYHFRVDGPVKVVLRPFPTLVVDDVGIADAHAVERQEFFTAKRLRIELSLWALVRGDARITDVTILHAVVRMASGARTRGSPGPRPSGNRSAHVVVRHVNIDDGVLLFHKPRGQTKTLLEGIHLVASVPADAGIDLAGSARWGGEAVNVSAKSEGPIDLGDERAAGVSVKLERKASPQSTVSFSGKLSLVDQALKFEDVKGTAGEDAFAGNAALDFADSKPRVRGKLDFDRLWLDLGTTSSSSNENGSNASRSARDAGWSDQPFDFAPLNLFDGDVRLSAGEMRIAKARLGHATLEVKLDDGMLSAMVSPTRLYGGQAGGSFVLNVSGEQPRCTAQFELVAVNALPLLLDAVDFDHLEGRLNAKFHLEATGNSPKVLISTLGGDAGFSIENGSIRGVNVAKLVRLLTRTTLEGWQENEVEKTSLDTFGATFKIENGLATTSDLRISGSRVQVTGSGTIDLPAKRLDLRTDPKLFLGGGDQEGSEDALGLGVPVIVRGPWSNPQFYPDVANVLDHPAKAYAKLAEFGAGLFGLNKKQSGSSLDSIFDGLGSMLEGLGHRSESTDPPKAAQAEPQETQATKRASQDVQDPPGRSPPAAGPPQEEAKPSVDEPGRAQSPGDNQPTRQRFAAAASGGRVALVIGNRNYPDNSEPLVQPTKDAHAVADELKHAKFEVILGENLSKHGMRTAIDNFKTKVKPGLTALIFFSGFGIQAEKQSYIIPVDAQIWTEPDVSRDGTSLEKILADLDSLGAGTKIAIIDASRKNPYERRFRRYSAGLATIDAPTGTLVISAAAPGRVGVDERGSSSLFISELLKEMRSPGLSAEEVFSRTRVDVSHASNNAQVPWVSSSLSDVFYFNRTEALASDYGLKESPGTQSAKSEPPQSEPFKRESPKSEAPRAEPPKEEPPRTEIAKTEPSKPEPAKTEPSNNEADVSGERSREQAASPSKTPSAETSEAIRKLDDEIRAHPDDANAYYRRGQVYAENADYQHAVADFNEAVRLNPNDPEALNNRCWTRAVLGQLQAAIDDCNSALRLKPNYADALDSRGLVNLKLGHYRQAIADFDATLKVNPKQVSSLYGRGWAKLKTGDTTGGNADVKLAQALDPNIADEFAGYGVGP